MVQASGRVNAKEIKMKRRDFLRFLLTTPLAYELDVEKLLWIPGEKTIFIPSSSLSYDNIILAELQNVVPKLRVLFEKDVTFWRTVKELETH